MRRRFFFRWAFDVAGLLVLSACAIDERNLTFDEPSDAGDAAHEVAALSPDGAADAGTDASFSDGARTGDASAEMTVGRDGSPDQSVHLDAIAETTSTSGADETAGRDAPADRNADDVPAERDAAVLADASDAGLTAASLALAAAVGSSVNFGNVTTGTSGNETFVLSNAGQQATGIGVNVTGAGFARIPGVAGDCGATISGGLSCNIGVRFNATALGAQTGSLAVTAASGSAPAPVGLSATAVCPAGQTACSGVCTSAANDASNCGRCGHGCLTGGTCSTSICQPVSFVATAQTSNVVDIATDGNVIVWADSGDNSIDQVGSPGAAKIVLGSSSIVNAPLNVGMDGSSGTIFWAQQDGTIGFAARGTANSAGLTGCIGATPIAAINVSSSTRVDILSPGFLATCAITPGMAGSGFVLADTSFPSGEVGRTLTPGWFLGDVANQAVIELGVSGDFNPVILATIPLQSSVLYVVQDSSFVYWSAATGAGPAILRAPLATPTAAATQTILPNAGGVVGGMTTDGVNVYFQNGSGIFYIPVAGGAAATRLTALNGLFLKYASGAVYFASGGAIFKIATP